MSPESWLVLVNRIYFGAGAVAALATAITVATGLAQSRLSDAIADRKDREFAEFKLTSEERVAELQRQTARLKIEQKLTPRSLDAAQKETIRASLVTLSGTSLDVIACGDTPEIGNLIKAIIQTLQTAGWNVRVWASIGGGGLAVIGIPIQTQAGSDLFDEKAADSLVAALQDVGLASARVIPFEGTDLPMALTGPEWNRKAVAKIRMLVGTKP